MGALRPRRGRELRDLYGPLRPRPAPPAPRSHDVPEIPAEPTLRPTATPCAQRGSARGTRRAVGKEKWRSEKGLRQREGKAGTADSRSQADVTLSSPDPTAGSFPAGCEAYKVGMGCSCTDHVWAP